MSLSRREKWSSLNFLFEKAIQFKLILGHKCTLPLEKYFLKLGHIVLIPLPKIRNKLKAVRFLNHPEDNQELDDREFLKAISVVIAQRTRDTATDTPRPMQLGILAPREPLNEKCKAFPSRAVGLREFSSNGLCAPIFFPNPPLLLSLSQKLDFYKLIPHCHRAFSLPRNRFPLRNPHSGVC